MDLIFVELILNLKLKLDENTVRNDEYLQSLASLEKFLSLIIS